MQGRNYGLACAGLVIAFVMIGGTASAQQDPLAPHHCRWSPASAGAWTLACTGQDGEWVPADPPYDIDRDTVAKANAGSPDAMVALGLFYLDGPGAPRDAQAGLTWLRTASDRRSAVAPRYLGESYLYGYGAPKDLAEAMHWFSIAAQAGDARGMTQLALLYASGAGVTQDYGQAARWSRAAADKGDVDGMVALGGLYYRGLGVQKDDTQAVRWFRAAADKGDFHGMQALSFMINDGLGAPKDELEVKRLHQLASSTLHWSHVPSEQELQLSYPTDAAAAGIVGKVYFRCELARDRSVHHCQLASEDPPGHEFGKAGRSIIGTFQMGPGLPAGSVINVPIRYALPINNRIESQPMADTCAAYAIAISRVRPLTGIADWWARYWQALSRRYALADGGADTPGRLADLISNAAQRLTDGKDQGFLGRVSQCHLRG